MSEAMRISPRYDVDDWKRLTFSAESDWQKAIDIFADRIHGRFLKVVDMIEHYKHAGFAVMALDCLLIETLQQFREGDADTPKNKSGEYFVRFLTDTAFADFFTKEMAANFYDQIRCGILHQAETKENSILLIRSDIPLVAPTPDGRGLVINRILFHKQLVRVFEEYVSSLRDPSQAQVRSNLRKKMDLICRNTPSEP
jgi:hypothetical protein